MDFSTQTGPQRVPRRSYPLHPSPQMMQNARRGKISIFLRSGKITRPSNFEPMVDLQTAKLNLTDDIQSEMDRRSKNDEQFPESQRKMENLFYMSVKDDELPSYPLRKAEIDANPVDTCRNIDGNQILSKSAAAQEALADLTCGMAHRKTVTVANPRPTPTAQNAWTKARDGEICRKNDPKKDWHLRSKNWPKAETKCQWRPEGTLLGIPFNSSNQCNAEDLGQFGPQPGEPDWENHEAVWEQNLEMLGIRGVLKEYRSSNPDRFKALRYGIVSSRVQPARGDDQYARQFNDILKTAVPTVAFKLTQQTFERPVSPINFQEPLVHGKYPKGWNLHGEEAENFDSVYEVVHHEEEELEFLDLYNEKSHGRLLLRSKLAIPHPVYLSDLIPVRTEINSRRMYSPGNSTATSKAGRAWKRNT